MTREDAAAAVAKRYPGCSCTYEWRPLGKLYGISMGHSWVRLNDEPDCPWHGKDQS